MPMRELSILGEAMEHAADCDESGKPISADLIRRLAGVVRSKDKRIKELIAELSRYKAKKRRVIS